MPIMLLCMNIMPIKASTASAPIIAKMISIAFNIGEADFIISPFRSVLLTVRLGSLYKVLPGSVFNRSILDPVLKPRVKSFLISLITFRWQELIDRDIIDPVPTPRVKVFKQNHESTRINDRSARKRGECRY
jgi:hypothetical protein